jgi:hypothetical protein
MCTEEVEVLEVKVDKDFDDAMSTPGKRLAFESEFKKEVSDRLDLGGPDNVDILELREGSIVVEIGDGRANYHHKPSGQTQWTIPRP